MKNEKGDKGDRGQDGKDGLGLTPEQQKLVNKLPEILNGFAGLPLAAQILIPLTIIVISVIASIAIISIR